MKTKSSLRSLSSHLDRPVIELHCSLSLPDRRLDFGRHIDNRSVENACDGSSRCPNASRWVNGYEIPEDAVVHATRLLRLRRARATCELIRNYVVLVPELLNATIRQASQNEGAWGAPVTWQDRLPNCKDTDVRFTMLFEKVVHCGGPPQTSGSRRRQQQQDPRLILRRIEPRLQIQHWSHRDVSERGLLGRDAMRQNTRTETDEHDEDDSGNCERRAAHGSGEERCEYLRKQEREDDDRGTGPQQNRAEPAPSPTCPRGTQLHKTNGNEEN